VTSRPDAITNGPLADASSPSDVFLLRTNARGIMTIGDAIPELAIDGKPQCQSWLSPRSSSAQLPVSAVLSAAPGPAWVRMR